MDENTRVKSTIVIDEKELRDNVMKGLKLAQTYADKNHIKVKISGDASEINELIKRLQMKNPEVKIRLNTSDVDKKTKSISILDTAVEKLRSNMLTLFAGVKNVGRGNNISILSNTVNCLNMPTT